MKQIRKRLTYANVMSSIAVFLVIGGATAFAALGKNTVGTKQLKKNAVTTTKIKNGAITSSKVNVSGFPKVPSATSADSATNATHAGNADNATHANNADNATNAAHAISADKAIKATTAASASGASAPETLASGKTVRGHYHIELNTGSGGANNPDMGQGYSYIFSLASTPEAHFIPNGEVPPAECPGTVEDPEASPGNLCVYEGPSHANDLVDIGTESDQYGFGLLLIITGSNNFGWSIGSWAVTAP